MRMLDVGLIASDTVMACPVEMPPRIPPALLPEKPVGVISSPCSDPLCATQSKPAPIEMPLTAFKPIMTCAISRSEEHTSEIQSLMRISYAVFCLKKKNKYPHQNKMINDK